MSNLNAQILKKHFGAYGYFYDLSIGELSLSCRCSLEIVHHDITPLNLNEIYQHPIDLIVLMMNPGSSRPINSGYKPQAIFDPTLIFKHRELVPTRPDITQYQVMKIMHAKGYQHARILNLSDIRQAKSSLFLKQIVELSETTYTDKHSVFSKERKKDLDKLMGLKENTPIIAGWGRDKGLLPLAKLCLKNIDVNRIIGIPVNKERTLFAHPSPMLQSAKEKWIVDILNKISSNS